MPTLYSIKQQVAAYLDRTVADLTVDGVDLFLEAVNHARREAEQTHDFEFSRRLVQLSVNGVTGGDIGNAVLKSDGTTAVNVKTVIDVGQFDTSGNLRPIEWTTVAESLERQREESNYAWLPRSPSDGYFEGQVQGYPRVAFSGTKVFLFPKDSVNTYTLGMEVYGYQADWASVDVEAVTITGTLSPDATGTYLPGPISNGALTYFKLTGNVGTGNYILTRTNAGAAWYLALFEDYSPVMVDNKWTLTSTSTSPAGSYPPDGGGTNTGTAIVAVGSAVSDTWTTQGSQYLIWSTIIRLNHRFKHFVFRQEGNLPPPKDLADAGLAALIDWDAHRFDQFRRHGR